jgi:DNA repair exonuclease SbcCD ATPase subunit
VALAVALSIAVDVAQHSLQEQLAQAHSAGISRAEAEKVRAAELAYAAVFVSWLPFGCFFLCVSFQPPADAQESLTRELLELQQAYDELQEAHAPCEQLIAGLRKANEGLQTTQTQLQQQLASIRADYEAHKHVLEELNAASRDKQVRIVVDLARVCVCVCVCFAVL